MVVVDTSLWSQCVMRLEDELSSADFERWIRPLRAEVRGGQTMVINAANRFVTNWVKTRYSRLIEDVLYRVSNDPGFHVRFETGLSSSGIKTKERPKMKPLSGKLVQPQSPPSASASSEKTEKADEAKGSSPQQRIEFPKQQQLILAVDEEEGEASSIQAQAERVEERKPTSASKKYTINLNHHTNTLSQGFTFDSFVEGKSNQLARAAAAQVAENPGEAYNPLFLYGGVGLGKTHLMHAVGNLIQQHNRNARIAYLHSERFVGDMVKALQNNAIDAFKGYYRDVDALLIDDIQFFAGKERSQEEFFYTFNSLLEGNQQIILTCDRYPKELNGLEERLKSRFGWGLTVAIEPPELETRVAILMTKAEKLRIEIPAEVAFFIAKLINSNVRELEGGLRRVIAHAHFTGKPITLDFAQDVLKDLLALQEKLVTIENIQRTTAEYYKIKVSDLLSKQRSRVIARPRQMAMALAKELTSHSLPEIGEAFGGRDHTTVLHACRKVEDLKMAGGDFREDYVNLVRILSSS